MRMDMDISTGRVNRPIISWMLIPTCCSRWWSEHRTWTWRGRERSDVAGSEVDRPSSSTCVWICPWAACPYFCLLPPPLNCPCHSGTGWLMTVWWARWLCECPPAHHNRSDNVTNLMLALLASLHEKRSGDNNDYHYFLNNQLICQSNCR